MAWKIQLAVAAAAIMAIVIFRQQISGALGQAGGAIGSGFGNAFTGFFNSFGAALQAGTAGWGDFLAGGGAAGQWLRENQQQKEQTTSSQTKTYMGKTIKVGGGGSTKTDQVITPATREYSDSTKPYFDAFRKAWG